MLFIPIVYYGIDIWSDLNRTVVARKIDETSYIMFKINKQCQLLTALFIMDT